MFIRRAILGLFLLLPACAPPVFEITIEGNDLMQFSVKSFEVDSGATVRLTLKNAGQLPKEAMGHNLVVLKRGITPSDFGSQLVSRGASMENEHLPEGMRKDTIAYSRVLGPGESQTIEFVAPSPGVYYYVCTFPGHFATMNGVMTVN